jgi:hypothetical protein
MDISKSLLFVTQSTTPSPNPANHYGYLYASGSSLWWKNNLGQVYDLGLSSGSLNINYYTGSIAGTQTYTWNRDPRLKYITVICVGAGGGGGGGMSKGTNAQAARGGLGGGGGAIVWTRFQKSDLPTTATITVGVGGNGGPSVSYAGGTNDTLGIAGTNGGSTSFGSLVIAGGGDGGSGGGQVLATAIQGGRGGGNHNSTPSYGLYCLNGNYGGYGITGNTPSGQNSSFIGGAFLIALNPIVNNGTSQLGTPAGGGSGGGGGGCISNASVPSIAGSGSGVLTRTGTISTGIPGAAGTGAAGSNGQDNVGKDLILQFGNVPLPSPTNLITSSYGLGEGGNGGGSNTALSPGGNGGNGGLYGAGGGGGGVGKQASSGAGGNGSPGLCILIEYY